MAFGALIRAPASRTSTNRPPASVGAPFSTVEQQALEEKRRQFNVKTGLQQDLLQQLLGRFLGSNPLTGGGAATPPPIGQPGFADSPSAPGSPSTPGGPDIGGIGGSLLDQLSGVGMAERQRINRQFTSLGNTVAARLEERGFGGSNLLAPQLAAVEEQRSQALGDLSSRLLRERIGVQERQQERDIDLIGALTGIFGAL